jgi:ribonuclease Z
VKLHVLGAGTPDPGAERYGSGFLLELDDPQRLVMVDCGPASTYKMARMGIKPTQVGQLFLTHHHFDHNADVPCFVLTRWDQTAPTAQLGPLPVFGPPPTAAFMDRLFGEPHGAYYPDWRARLETPASLVLHVARGGTLPRTPPAFTVVEPGPGWVYQDDRLRVTAATLHHVEPWLQSLGYRFETPGGTVVFTGDAGASPALDALCQGADVLVLCCAYGWRKGLAPEVAHCVTGVEDAARIAAASGARLVILDHCNRDVVRPGKRERYLSHIGQHYAGRFILADELHSYELD